MNDSPEGQPLTYGLSKLAAGSYDVIMASLVRSNAKGSHGQMDGRTPGRSSVRTAAALPFTAPEHRFATPEEACRWLGVTTG